MNLKKKVSEIFNIDFLSIAFSNAASSLLAMGSLIIYSRESSTNQFNSYFILITLINILIMPIWNAIISRIIIEDKEINLKLLRFINNAQITFGIILLIFIELEQSNLLSFILIVLFSSGIFINGIAEGILRKNKEFNQIRNYKLFGVLINIFIVLFGAIYRDYFLPILLIGRFFEYSCYNYLFLYHFKSYYFLDQKYINKKNIVKDSTKKMAILSILFFLIVNSDKFIINYHNFDPKDTAVYFSTFFSIFMPSGKFTEIYSTIKMRDLSLNSKNKYIITNFIYFSIFIFLTSFAGYLIIFPLFKLDTLNYGLAIQMILSSTLYHLLWIFIFWYLSQSKDYNFVIKINTLANLFILSILFFNMVTLFNFTLIIVIAEVLLLVNLLYKFRYFKEV